MSLEENRLRKLVDDRDLDGIRRWVDEVVERAREEATREAQGRPPEMSNDEIVRKLTCTLYLYPHYRVDSRGPRGLLMDVIKELRPDVHEVIGGEGADFAFARFFRKEGD